MKHTFKDQIPTPVEETPTLIEEPAVETKVEEVHLTETFPLKGKITGEPMVNLRSEPNGNVIAILQEGTAVDILGASTDDWMKVQANNKTGYVMSKYVKGV